MSLKLYVPVSLEMLPEYLSSGFIGLKSSLEPSEDLQSSIFPNIVGFKSCDKYKTDVYLEIDYSAEFESKEINQFADTILIVGPISIANIVNIIFDSAEEKDNFIASFSMLSDIPLSLFEISVLDQDSPEKLTVSAKDLKKALKPKKSKIQNELSRILALFVGIKESVTWINTSIDFEADITINRVNSKKILQSITKSILDKANYLTHTIENSFDLLELYIIAIQNIQNSSHGLIDSPKLINEMLLLTNSKYQDSNQSYFTRFLEKANNILMGVERRPEFRDDPSLTLQRAIFLAILIENLDSFEKVRQNFNVGPLVESLAKVLLMYKVKLSYVPFHFWRADRASFNKFLKACERVFITNSFHLKTEKLPSEYEHSLNIKQNITINGMELSSFEIEPTAHLQLVNSNLKTLGYNKTRSCGLGNIMVEYFDNSSSGEESKFDLILEMASSEINQHKYVKIMVRIENGNTLLNTKKTREKLFLIMSEFMVSPCFVKGDNALFISRSQLVGRMDTDELNDHLQLVASAFKAISAM